MKKVLIISYYWPPSGGAGVQRWLKLSKYLCELGVQVHVLTVDEKSASYMQLDTTLAKDIHPGVTVHKTKSFEPINYYAKLVGKNKVPQAGFSNVNNKKVSQKIINGIRSNFFIPDPRKGWKRFAVKRALEIIKKENIQTIITTSPPHSSQLIGLSLKKQLDIKWISDLRDPWTDIYYYDLLGHSKISRSIDKKIEKKIIEQSDKIITVSQGLKSIFLSKSTDISSDKIVIIPNGYDPADFSNRAIKSDEFTICYSGTISDLYAPESFFDALKQFILSKPEDRIKFQLIGSISESINDYIEKLEIPFEMISTVPHSEINQYQQNADVLLLVIPDVNHNKGILTGKLFEYLATKNEIIGLGPTDGDAAQIITRCRAGKMHDRNEQDAMLEHLNQAFSNCKNNIDSTIDEKILAEYSRSYQATQVKELI